MKLHYTLIPHRRTHTAVLRIFSLFPHVCAAAAAGAGVENYMNKSLELFSHFLSRIFSFKRLH
jgi:hypothetical protein